MASENIGNVYPTKIPGYDDSADIQAALRLNHTMLTIQIHPY
jgi:hypothetical protein